METRFDIDRLKYCLHIDKSGNVWLDLRGGTTKKGNAYRSPSKDLFWDEPYFEDVDLGIDALKVLKKVKQILLAYVFYTRPWRIRFVASTNRKVGIYRWLAKRLASQMLIYNLVEYPVGEFNFYRLHKLACNT